MKIKILRSCVGDGGETLEADKSYDQKDNTARMLIGAGQAAEEAPAKEPAKKKAKG